MIHIFDVKFVTLHKPKELMKISSGYDFVIDENSYNNFVGKIGRPELSWLINNLPCFIIIGE